MLSGTDHGSFRQSLLTMSEFSVRMTSFTTVPTIQLGRRRQIWSLWTSVARVGSICPVGAMSNCSPSLPPYALSIIWRYCSIERTILRLAACWMFGLHRSLRTILMSSFQMMAVRQRYGRPPLRYNLCLMFFPDYFLLVIGQLLLLSWDCRWVTISVMSLTLRCLTFF